MAACFEFISREKASRMLSTTCGMRITRPWPGYGSTMMLELGKLRTEVLHTRKGIRRSRKGQVSLMIDPNWRVEKRYSISFASGFTEKRRNAGIEMLADRRINEIVVMDCLPELQLSLDDGRRIRTFSDWTAQPNWTVLFYDKRLLELSGVWDGVDVTPCLHVRAGRIIVEYCFDQADIDIKRLKGYHFYPRRGKGRFCR